MVSKKPWIVWSERKQAWYDKQKGQFVKLDEEPAPVGAAQPAPVPQTLTEAPSAERELHEEEVNHYYGNQVEEEHVEEEE